ncbi:hypothetical protein D3C72_2010250 [compost metagenome]
MPIKEREISSLGTLYCSDRLINRPIASERLFSVPPERPMLVTTSRMPNSS